MTVEKRSKVNFSSKEDCKYLLNSKTRPSIKSLNSTPVRDYSGSLTKSSMTVILKIITRVTHTQKKSAWCLCEWEIAGFSNYF